MAAIVRTFAGHVKDIVFLPSSAHDDKCLECLRCRAGIDPSEPSCQECGGTRAVIVR